MDSTRETREGGHHSLEGDSSHGGVSPEPFKSILKPFGGFVSQSVIDPEDPSGPRKDKIARFLL